MTALTQRPGPWDQRIDESDAEYRCFRGWLGEPGCSRALPSDTSLAARLHWTDRAVAWDALGTLPDTPAECAVEAIDRLMRIWVLEARKYEHAAATSPTPVVELKEIGRGVKELAAAIALLKGLPQETHFHLGADTPPEALRLIQRVLRNQLPESVE